MAKSNAAPDTQEVTKVGLLQCQEIGQIVEQNVGLSIVQSASFVAAKFMLGNITLRFFDGAGE